MNKLSIVKNLSLDDLRKMTWDYSDVDMVGYYGETLIRKWMFEAIDFRSPILVRRCNVSEGWIEYLIIKGGEPRTIQDFNYCEILRNTDGSPVCHREKYTGRLAIKDTKSGGQACEIVIIS